MTMRLNTTMFTAWLISNAQYIAGAPSDNQCLAPKVVDYAEPIYNKPLLSQYSLFSGSRDNADITTSGFVVGAALLLTL
jgi:hypothetical protein